MKVFLERQNFFGMSLPEYLALTVTRALALSSAFVGDKIVVTLTALTVLSDLLSM